MYMLKGGRDVGRLSVDKESKGTIILLFSSKPGIFLVKQGENKGECF
jgi:hypothetical protein